MAAITVPCLPAHVVEGTRHHGIHGSVFLGLFFRAGAPFAPSLGHATAGTRSVGSLHPTGVSGVRLTLDLCLPAACLSRQFTGAALFWWLDGGPVPVWPGDFLAIADSGPAGRTGLVGLPADGLDQEYRRRRQCLPLAACRLGGLCRPLARPRAVAGTCSALAARANWLLALAIVWSTLATRQHVLLDVIAGFLLGLLFAFGSLRQLQRTQCRPLL